MQGGEQECGGDVGGQSASGPWVIHSHLWDGCIACRGSNVLDGDPGEFLDQHEIQEQQRADVDCDLTEPVLRAPHLGELGMRNGVLVPAADVDAKIGVLAEFVGVQWFNDHVADDCQKRFEARKAVEWRLGEGLPQSGQGGLAERGEEDGGAQERAERKAIVTECKPLIVHGKDHGGKRSNAMMHKV